MNYGSVIWNFWMHKFKANVILMPWGHVRKLNFSIFIQWTPVMFWHLWNPRGTRISCQIPPFQILKRNKNSKMSQLILISQSGWFWLHDSGRRRLSCLKLLKGNVSKMEWNQPICGSSNVNHYGFNEFRPRTTI